MESDDKRALFEPSIDRRLVEDRLRKATVGELVSYSELAGIIDRDMQNGGRGVLTSARRALERDGVIFAVVRDEGVKRLSDPEIVKTGEDTIARARRASRRGYRRVSMANYDKLSKEDQVTHNAYLSILGALAAVTKTSSVRRVEARVAESRECLPLAATLEAFKS